MATIVPFDSVFLGYVYSPSPADSLVLNVGAGKMVRNQDTRIVATHAPYNGLVWKKGIDEELLIASIGRRRQDGTLYHAQEPPAPAPEEKSVPETEPPPAQYTAKEKPQRDTVRRKRQEDDYSGLFLRRNEIKTRQCVYISRDVHSKILKIVNDIAGREISVGGYVDTVLRQHLEQHKEKINELYKKQREDLI